MTEKNIKIRRFPSGAVRSDDTGRERPDFISPYAIKAIGEHFAKATGEFGGRNYFLGIPEVEVFTSLMRHTTDLYIALLTNDIPQARKEWQALADNAIMGLHTHEIIRLGTYKEFHKKTELIDADGFKESLENGAK